MNILIRGVIVMDIRPRWGDPDKILGVVHHCRRREGGAVWAGRLNLNPSVDQSRISYSRILARTGNALGRRGCG